MYPYKNNIELYNFIYHVHLFIYFSDKKKTIKKIKIEN